MKQNGQGAPDTLDMSSAAERVSYARSLGPVAFSALLARIEAAFHKASASVTSARCFHSSSTSQTHIHFLALPLSERDVCLACSGAWISTS